MRKVAAAAAVIVALIIGVWFGGHPSWMPGWLRSGFAPESKSEQQFHQILGMINENYYRPVNDESLVNVGLQAAVASLNDPYSHYFPAQQQSEFQQETNPQDSGIGVEVSPETTGMLVVEVFPGGPAAKDGIHPGDLIVGVGKRSIKGVSANDATALIKGSAGTTVRITVDRGKRTLHFAIVRETIVVPVTASKLLHYHGKKIGYMEFTQFTEGSANQLRRQLEQMLHQGAQGLILDLRDNPGGLVTQAIGVASLFVKHGVIVSTRGRSQSTTVFDALGDAIAPSIPLVVLVDRGTASSAEIVTAALQQHHRALVVGTRTYGKGVFQESETLPWGAILDITVGQFFTPDGHNLGGSGVINGRSVTRGPGIKPNVYAADNPTAPGLLAVEVGERVLAGEIHG
jgi:carboxyl-terminal processing protease